MGDIVISCKSDGWCCKLILYLGDIENVYILILKVIVRFCKVGKIWVIELFPLNTKEMKKKV
jgi:hypothetical protein